MRTPTYTTAEIEIQLGPRGRLIVNGDNRPTVRKWLTAQGYPAAFVAGLSMREMGLAYNQTDGSGLNAITKKYNESKAEIDAEAALAAIDTTNALPPPAGHGEQKNAPQKDRATLLRDILLEGYEPGLNEARVLELIQQHSPAPRATVIEIRRPDVAPVIIEGHAHPQLERCVRYLSTVGPNGFQTNVMLVGPAGCGKTHLIEQVARALGVDHTIIACTAGTTEGDFYGRLLPGQGGNFEYVPAEAIRLYERGNALIAFDEADKLDPNMAACANMPLANGHWYCHLRKDNPRVKRGPNVFFMATANTYGKGANLLYVGSGAQDEATRDRYSYITVDYDNVLEESIGTAGTLTAAEMAGIWELRDRCRDAGLRRTISTRAFQKAAVWKLSGDNWLEIRDRLLEGWTADEKTKVGA